MLDIEWKMEFKLTITKEDLDKLKEYIWEIKVYPTNIYRKKDLTYERILEIIFNSEEYDTFIKIVRLK